MWVLCIEGYQRGDAPTAESAVIHYIDLSSANILK